MNSNVEKMIQKLKENPDFQKKIVAAASREQVIELAKEEGIQLTSEDIDVVNEVSQQDAIANIDQSRPAGKFLAKMLGDKDFAEQVVIQTDPEALLDLAKEEGISLTMQDMEEVNQALIALSGGNNAATVEAGELSEEDLEQVAGGFAIMTCVTVATTIMSMVSTITAMSAMTALSGLATAAITIQSIQNSFQNKE